MVVTPGLAGGLMETIKIELYYFMDIFQNLVTCKYQFDLGLNTMVLLTNDNH